MAEETQEGNKIFAMSELARIYYGDDKFEYEGYKQLKYSYNKL